MWDNPWTTKQSRADARGLNDVLKKMTAPYVGARPGLRPSIVPRWWFERAEKHFAFVHAKVFKSSAPLLSDPERQVVIDTTYESDVTCESCLAKGPWFTPQGRTCTFTGPTCPSCFPVEERTREPQYHEGARKVYFSPTSEPNVFKTTLTPPAPPDPFREGAARAFGDIAARASDAKRACDLLVQSSQAYRRFVAIGVPKDVQTTYDVTVGGLPIKVTPDDVATLRPNPILPEHRDTASRWASWKAAAWTLVKVVVAVAMGVTAVYARVKYEEWLR